MSLVKLVHALQMLAVQVVKFVDPVESVQILVKVLYVDQMPTVFRELASVHRE